MHIHYNKDEINTDAPFYVTELQGYTVNAGNSLEIYGNKLLDSQFVSPKSGSHFELKQNYSDVFDNLSNGSLIGTGATFNVVSNVPSLTLNSSNTYFQLSSDPDAGFNSTAFVGTDGLNDSVFAVWVNVPSLPAVGTKKFIYHYGTTADYGCMYLDSNGKINFEYYKSSVLQTFTTPESVIIGWNKLCLNRKGSSNDYTFFYLNTVKSTISFSGLIIPASTVAYPIKIGTGFVSDVLTSSTGYSFANVYIKYKGYISQNQVNILATKPTPSVIFQDKNNPLIEYVVSNNWVGGIHNDMLSFTIPPTTELPNGEFYLILKSQFHTSTPFLVNVQNVITETEAFYDDFSDENTLRNNYLVLNRAWGGANGGVIPDNVFLRNNELILKANGDNYSGTLQGVDRDGLKKIHTNVSDPKFNQPWTNRVGGCVVYNKRTGFGSYEIDTLIPNQLGVAYAMWTFFYNEIYPTDTRYNDFIAEGLHQQGTVDDGYFITRNHEIDIELPSHLSGGTLSNPSLSNMKNNTWRGELYNESEVNLQSIGFNIADGNYHKLRFDWYPDRVEFYIDGILKKTNTSYIPDISGFFTFGVWFPSSPLTTKPWLTNPNNAWAGGVIDADGGMKADFDSVEMKVKSFRFTPFSYPAQQRNLGETYPFGGYNKKQ